MKAKSIASARHVELNMNCSSLVAMEFSGIEALGSWDISGLTGSRPLFTAPLLLSAVSTSEEAARGQETFQAAIEEATGLFESGSLERGLLEARRAREIQGFERAPEALHLWRRLERTAARAKLRGVWCRDVLQGGSSAIIEIVAGDNGTHVMASTSGGKTDRLLRWNLHRREGDDEWSAKVNSTIMNSPMNVMVSGNMQVMLSSYSSAERDTFFWAMPGLKPLSRIKGDMSAPALSYDGRLAAGRGRGGVIRIIETESGKEVRVLEGCRLSPSFFSFSPDAGILLHCAFNRSAGKVETELGLWDLRKGERIHTITEKPMGILSVQVTPCGRSAIVLLQNGANSQVDLWDLQKGEQLKTVVTAKNYEAISAYALSGDGRWLAAAIDSRPPLLAIWDLEGEALPVRELSGHTARITALCFSRDHRFLFSGSEDKSLRSWELDWEIEYRAPEPWNTKASCHLDRYLSLHALYGKDSSHREWPFQVIAPPPAGDNDVEAFFELLGDLGFGWLTRQGVSEQYRARVQELYGHLSIPTETVPAEKVPTEAVLTEAVPRNKPSPSFWQRLFGPGPGKK
jgi:hypothetical protein